MLYQIGRVVFDVAPVNVHEVSHEAETSYARKEVLGRRPILEYTGEGPSKLTFNGKLFPHKWAELLGDSGLTAMEQLDAQRRSGIGQYLMRGDGAAFGWWAIVKITAKGKTFDGTGIAREIDFEIELEKAEAPSPQAFTASQTTSSSSTQRKPKTGKAGKAPAATPSTAQPVHGIGLNGMTSDAELTRQRLGQAP